VGGIGWLRNGRRILVAAEIVNHSVCDSPGTFAAYEVDVETLQITARYSQLEAKRRFAPLLDTVGEIDYVTHCPKRAKVEVRVRAGGIPHQ
jgi:hypothetical protein